MYIMKDKDFLVTLCGFSEIYTHEDNFQVFAISVSVSNIGCVCLGQTWSGQCLDKTGSWEVLLSNYLYDLHRLQSVVFKGVKFNIFMIILCIDRETFHTGKHPILSNKKIRILENLTRIEYTYYMPYHISCFKAS